MLNDSLQDGDVRELQLPSSTGMCHSSITPVISIAGSQQVTSSGWQLTRSFSPLLPQAMDSLSAGHAPEIYQLAAECQALGSELTKQFQNLSRLEAVHHTAAQAAAHENIKEGCMACSATFGIATATQTDEEHKSYMCRLHIEANQAWKDANEVIFSHLLNYDTQLVAFISTAEGTLQAKCDEIWRCFHSLADTANIPHRICLPLALQTLDQLPAIPWDLSYCTGIPLMFAYGPESYDFQTWSTARDREYLLDNDTWATNLLSCKLVCMTDGAGPDDPSPIRATSPAGLAGSATPPLQHIHHPDPAPELPFTRLKRKGLDLAPHPAPTARRPNPSPQLPQMVKTVMIATQHPKRAMSLKKKDEADSDGGAPGDSKGSDGGGSVGDSSGGSSKISDTDGQDEDSDREIYESDSETEESDSESSSSSSESNDETLTKATLPVKKTSGSNPNISQMLSLPDLDRKDLKEERKIQQCKDAHLLDEKFGKWWDQMISKGHNEWNMHDTMTCDHADPCKEAKFPDPISNKYDLCQFYQVRLSGALPDFPSPHEPATHEWMHKFLLMARSLGWPN